MTTITRSTVTSRAIFNNSFQFLQKDFFKWRFARLFFNEKIPALDLAEFVGEYDNTILDSSLLGRMPSDFTTDYSQFKSLLEDNSANFSKVYFHFVQYDDKDIGAGLPGFNNKLYIITRLTNNASDVLSSSDKYYAIFNISTFFEISFSNASAAINNYDNVGNLGDDVNNVTGIVNTNSVNYNYSAVLNWCNAKESELGLIDLVVFKMCQFKEIKSHSGNPVLNNYYKDNKLRISFAVVAISVDGTESDAADFGALEP